jgi:hypothetical protein
MKKNMKNIKLTYIVIIGLLIYILFLQECSGSKKHFKNLKTQSIDTLKHTTDTIRISTIDTIILPLVTKYVTPTIAPPIILHDTIYIQGQGKVDSTYKYVNPYEDSLLVGTITSTSTGLLLSQKLEYTPKFPKYIIKKDSIIIDNTTIIEKKKLKLFIGAELGGNENIFNVSPIIDLKTRKGYVYGYRYGLVDKTHNIRFSKVLSFKSKK